MIDQKLALNMQAKRTRRRRNVSVIIHVGRTASIMAF